MARLSCRCQSGQQADSKATSRVRNSIQVLLIIIVMMMLVLSPVGRWDTAYSGLKREAPLKEVLFPGCRYIPG